MKKTLIALAVAGANYGPLQPQAYIFCGRATQYLIAEYLWK